MNNNNLAQIISAAIATAALTVVVCSGILVADPENSAPNQKISKPKLVSNGIEVTLNAVNGPAWKAGDQPKFELTAFNPTHNAAESNVKILMTSLAPSSPLSRMVAMPRMLWQGDQSLALAPGETRRIAIAPGIGMPSNSVVSVLLQNSSTSTNSAGTDQRALINPNNALTRANGGIVALTLSTAISPIIRVEAARMEKSAENQEGAAPRILPPGKTTPPEHRLYNGRTAQATLDAQSKMPQLTQNR